MKRVRVIADVAAAFAYQRVGQLAHRRLHASAERADPLNDVDQALLAELLPAAAVFLHDAVGAEEHPVTGLAWN